MTDSGPSVTDKREATSRLARAIEDTIAPGAGVREGDLWAEFDVTFTLPSGREVECEVIVRARR